MLGQRARESGSEFRTYAPLAAVALLTLIFCAGSLVVGARHIDAAEAQREETLLAQDSQRRVTEIEDRLNPFVSWDEALQHLDGAVDQTWADENIRQSIVKNPMFERAAVLSHDGAIVYVAEVRAEPGAAASIAEAAAPLIAEVRAREARRAPDAAVDPIRAGRFTIVRGEPLLVIASLVQSDVARHKPKFGRGPILITQSPLTVSVRNSLAERFHLSDLRVAAVPVGEAAKAAELPLGAPAEGRQIVLRWTPVQPGAALLSRAGPVLLLAAFCLTTLALFLIRHARSTTRKLIESKEEARRLASHDPLTGLPNRTLFSARTSRTTGGGRRAAKPAAVFFIDLDRFKEVNDTLGHKAGDELIQEVGRRLLAACRPEDTVARFGGDEFAVLQMESGPQAAASLAERIVSRLSGEVALGAGSALLSCSVGVTLLGDGVSQDEALRRADIALYRAKETGRGRYCFFEIEMDSALQERRALERDLREAVDLGQLSVVYQPIFDKAGVPVAVEALSRWTHPVKGAVPPSTFIPLAEESGMIGPIGRWMVRQVCIDRRRWPGLRTGVNISPVQLRRPDFLPFLDELLAEEGARACDFVIEITEGLLLKDDAQTQDVLAGLRKRGFMLSLDDFGTGYSSLSYLHRYPVQSIKLDRSFTSGLDRSPAIRTIVESVIRMANALDLTTVAEGVETQAQFEILRELGCAAFQGFFFCRPSAAGDVEALVRKAEPNSGGPPAPVGTSSDRATAS